MKKNSSTEKPQWFESWFNESYQEVYSDRDENQAKQQVNFLKSFIENSTNRVLDIGCGEGRHLIEMKSHFSNVFGMDLSSALLKQAKAIHTRVLRGDMRTLPIPDESLNLITSFFSSFGYFENKKTDEMTLKEWSRTLVSRGHLFLDLMNKNFLKNNFVEKDQKQFDEFLLKQERFIEKDVVIKKIEIHRSNGSIEKYQERLRLYSLADIENLAGLNSLFIEEIFGNETGDKFDSRISPRMSILFRKNR